MEEEKQSELIKLEVAPDGKLLAHWYHYYKNRPEGQRRVDETIDASENLFCYLFDPIEFHADLKLGDIFLLLSKNEQKLINLLFGHCLSEYTAEAITVKDKPLKVVKYLEFFYSYSEGEEIWSNQPILRGEFPQIIGRDGKGREYALQYLRPGQYKNCPVKLNKVMTIKKDDKIKYSYEGAFFNLSNVLNGLSKDLGFHGSPKDRDAFIRLLKKRMKDVKAGNAKTYTVEEFMIELRKKLETLKEKKKNDP